MCDIYTAQCEKKNCGRMLDVHIGDFCVSRKKVKVYCETHTPKSGWFMVFRIIEQCLCYRPGEFVVFQITDRKHQHNIDISPNGCIDDFIIFTNSREGVKKNIQRLKDVPIP